MRRANDPAEPGRLRTREAYASDYMVRRAGNNCDNSSYTSSEIRCALFGGATYFTGICGTCPGNT